MCIYIYIYIYIVRLTLVASTIDRAPALNPKVSFSPANAHTGLRSFQANTVGCWPPPLSVTDSAPMVSSLTSHLPQRAIEPLPRAADKQSFGNPALEHVGHM